MRCSKNRAADNDISSALCPDPRPQPSPGLAGLGTLVWGLFKYTSPLPAPSLAAVTLVMDGVQSVINRALHLWHRCAAIFAIFREAILLPPLCMKRLLAALSHLRIYEGTIIIRHFKHAYLSIDKYLCLNWRTLVITVWHADTAPRCQ